MQKNFDSYNSVKAVFPAGTVSGAPKVRAMQIIDELEPLLRGPYAGAVGYFSFNGSCDFAITIRSLFVNGRKAYIESGAGIVIDSDPALEWAETEHKANAILSALKKEHLVVSLVAQSAKHPNFSLPRFYTRANQKMSVSR